MAKRRMRRKLGGLGDAPRGHADKAHNEANHAIRAFLQVKKSKSCPVRLQNLEAGLVSMGMSQAHQLEAHGLVSKAGNRAPALQRAAEAAYLAVDECLADRNLAGLRRRKTSRRLGSAAVLDKPEQISHYRNLVLLKSLETEVKFPGMKMTRGPTAYSIIKAEFGLKGTKAKVLEQFHRMVKG